MKGSKGTQYLRCHGGCWWRCLPRTLGGGGRRRALGEERAELLLGEPPHALADLHRAEQALVLVDPAHRDLEPLGDLLGSNLTSAEYGHTRVLDWVLDLGF